MLDDFREQADTGSFFDDLEEEEQEAPRRQVLAPLSRNRFLGMTSVQRFILALLLLVATCLVSAACLLATGRIALF
jgi:hypothetical protein